METGSIERWPLGFRMTQHRIEPEIAPCLIARLATDEFSARCDRKIGRHIEFVESAVVAVRQHLAVGGHQFEHQQPGSDRWQHRPDRREPLPPHSTRSSTTAATDSNTTSGSPSPARRKPITNAIVIPIGSSERPSSARERPRHPGRAPMAAPASRATAGNPTSGDPLRPMRMEALEHRQDREEQLVQRRPAAGREHEPPDHHQPKEDREMPPPRQHHGDHRQRDGDPAWIIRIAGDLLEHGVASLPTARHRRGFTEPRITASGHVGEPVVFEPGQPSQRVVASRQRAEDQ